MVDHRFRPAEVKKMLISRMCDREARQLFSQQQQQQKNLASRATQAPDSSSIQCSSVAEEVVSFYRSYPNLPSSAVADVVSATAGAENKQTIWLMAATATAAIQSVKQFGEMMPASLSVQEGERSVEPCVEPQADSALCSVVGGPVQVALTGLHVPVLDSSDPVFTSLVATEPLFDFDWLPQPAAAVKRRANYRNVCTGSPDGR
jgi:hypothetical protein